MRAISDTLVTRLREFGALTAHEGVEPRASNTEAVVELRRRPAAARASVPPILLSCAESA